ncbi:MAG: hypothetical protein DI586_01275 [Micavibrio aeruginosavorus]|uniref:TNase-like domain-containing protein n=1 Tax=Micavibrio aeruginosavorus TaxID=349221 RepID=A0A2W5FMG0_9BACT|nr:MAG: hypothetical protein DI586_01275 [Micavibrio aeruginosavorus]
MLKKCLLACLATLLFLPQAYAESKYVSDKIPAGFFRELAQSPATVKVTKVIDPLTFMGDDKNIYSLSGIEVPNLQTGKKDFTLEASKTLALLIEDKDLKLYTTKTRDKGRINRMNQMLVQAELKQDRIWIQGEMLAAGLARVKTTSTNPELRDAMLAIETKARADKKGLWADSALQVLTPETAPGHENSFAIIEGAPKAAAITRNMIFLNYGDDYKKDFTVGIPTSLRVAFSKNNINPLQLANTKIRVRGWVQSYNGPFIEIDHPEQIEILGRISPFNKAQTEPAPNATGMRTIQMPKAPEVEKPIEPEIVTPKKKNAAYPNP